MLTAVIRDEQGGQVVGVVVAAAKTFATGSKGYHGQGKVEIAGRKYQAQLQLVEIGSKGQGEALEASAE
jgi:hypothetical protein